MNLAHIVAASTNHVISKEGKMPWHLPEDLKFFKDQTWGHKLIMGRKTFESLKKPLEKRLNLIVTRQKNYKPFTDKNVLFFPSIEKALLHAQLKNQHYINDRVFIIGGGEIYAQTLDLIDEIYLTRVDKNFEGDVFYPIIDQLKFKKISEKKAKNFDSQPIKYSFFHYIRNPSSTLA